MRAPLPLALLGLAALSPAQTLTPIAPAKAVINLKDAMVTELADPKVQVEIGVTSTQRYMMELRLSEDSLKSSLDLVKAYMKADDASGLLAVNTTFASSTSKALYPYLTMGQTAKLRRLVLAHDPLTSLGTEEVAFALTLTEAQRKSIEAIRAAHAKRLADPNRPSLRYLATAIAGLAKESAKVQEGFSGEDPTPEAIDAMRPLLTKMFRILEQTARLADKEPAVKTADPLALLTPAQRRRYRELSAIMAPSGPTDR